LLEEREVGTRAAFHGNRSGGVLGIAGLPHVRRSVARTTLQGGSGGGSPATVVRRVEWRVASVARVIEETSVARTLLLDVPGWPGHRPGQHVDVRLTADDGYQAQRSYSIASPPGEARLAITVERLE